MITAEAQARVREVALSWVGTPYRDRARVKGPEGGTDCAHLLIGVFSEAGLIKPFDPGFYPRDWHLHVGDERYLRYVLDYADETAPPWEPGDVLMFRGRPWPSSGHAGIYIGDGMIVHAVSNRRVEKWPLNSILLTHLWKGFRIRG